MNDEEMIASQGRTIMENEEHLRDLKRAGMKAIEHIVGVGGPLHDNALHYTQEQLAVFHRIMTELEDAT